MNFNTGENMTRQQKWQIKMKSEGRCVKCGKPVEGSKLFCLTHLIYMREIEAKKLGCKKKSNCRSRRLEQVNVNN